ncbi:hypothetical protein BH23ACT2_BH23ACT2_01330 [soil metagenome]
MTEQPPPPARPGLLYRLLGGSRAHASTEDDRLGDDEHVDEGHSSPVIDLVDETFDAGTEGGWTIVDFWAPWCGPCRTFHPMFERAAGASTSGVRFARVNVDTSPRTSAMVGIMRIPSVVLFDPAGNEAGRITGVPSPQDLATMVDHGPFTDGAGSTTPG